MTRRQPSLWRRNEKRLTSCLDSCKAFVRNGYIQWLCPLDQSVERGVCFVLACPCEDKHNDRD